MIACKRDAVGCVSMTSIDRLPFTNVLETHRLLRTRVAFEQDIGKAGPAGELQFCMHIHAARPDQLGPQRATRAISGVAQ